MVEDRKEEFATQGQMGERGGRMKTGQQEAKHASAAGDESRMQPDVGEKAHMGVGRSGSEGATPSRMSSVSPLDPWSGFRSEMERMFESFLGSMTPFSAFSRPAFGAFGSGFMMPQVDVTERDDAVEITAELPGMREEDIELTLRDGILTISGEKRQERKEGEGGNIHFSERRYGRFERSFRVPDNVQPDACKASFENGVLHVVLPKRGETSDRSRRIPIGRR